jgi:hypothetical protein
MKGPADALRGASSLWTTPATSQQRAGAPARNSGGIIRRRATRRSHTPRLARFGAARPQRARVARIGVASTGDGRRRKSLCKSEPILSGATSRLKNRLRAHLPSRSFRHRVARSRRVAVALVAVASRMRGDGSVSVRMLAPSPVVSQPRLSEHWRPPARVELRAVSSLPRDATRCAA